jgi:hypothetical protein
MDRIQKLLALFWPLSIAWYVEDKRPQRFGDRSSLRNVVVFCLLHTRRWIEAKISPIVLYNIHHHQNPFKSNQDPETAVTPSWLILAFNSAAISNVWLVIFAWRVWSGTAVAKHRPCFLCVYFYIPSVAVEWVTRKLAVQYETFRRFSHNARQMLW